MKKIDLIGQRFGRLTVLSEAEPHYQPNDMKRLMWNCLCDCGNQCVVSSNNLRSGITKSYGCYHSERVSQAKKKYNTFDLSGEYGICYTTKGESILFDIDDYEKIKDICWRIGQNGYVSGYKASNKHILMHRYIMDCPDGLTVDHINHNPLDNRRENMRIATYSQQEMNKDIRSNNPYGWDVGCTT